MLSASASSLKPSRAPGDPALDAAAFGNCFDGLESAGGLLIAASGGPDSTALILLAAHWARGLGPDAPNLFVATVDHGLRPEALAEARMVADLAAAHGLLHAILTWRGPKPATRIQERARAARYALLAAHADAIGATHVLTGHHRDDQAETILLRLGRGSGIGGLAGMRRLTRLEAGPWLVRPLLERSKQDLVDICRSQGCGFVEDGSNRDPAYARARLRAHAPALASLGLDAPGLVRLAARMDRANAALEAETDRVEAALPPAPSATIDLAGARDAAPEIALRLMRRALARAGGAEIRLERLETLTAAAWAALRSGRPYRSTLAGTRIILAADGRLSICREGPRHRGAGMRS